MRNKENIDFYDRDCYVYWIKTETMTDMFREGYIGISVSPNARFSAHKNAAKYGKKYNEDFAKSLIEGSCYLTTVCKAPIWYCFYLERQLRPDTYIGWNKAKGGNGGTPQHGLFDSGAAYSAWLYVRKRARSLGVELPEYWRGSEGCKNFVEWYGENSSEDTRMFLPTSGEVNKSTVNFQTVSEYLSTIRRIYSPFGDNRMYSLHEAAHVVGMRPNTVACRMSRGMSIEEALGLKDKDSRTITHPDGRLFYYGGKLSDADFIKMVDMYEEGVSLPTMSAVLGMDSGNLSRLGKKYSLSRPQEYYETFLGEIVEIGSTGKLTAKDYSTVKEMLLQGSTYTAIAKRIGVSESSMSSAIQRLKWKEYNSAKS